MRELMFIAAMLAVQALVVLHWFLWPQVAPLAALALAAGIVMTAMAAADVALLVGVLRRDVRDAQHAAELHDLATLEPLWLGMTALQVAFIVAAYRAGVAWLAAVLVLGQGSELLAVAVARVRTRPLRGSGAGGTGAGGSGAGGTGAGGTVAAG